MIISRIRSVSFLRPINNYRSYSYKPISRPQINSLVNKSYIDKKLNKFTLKEILKTKIEMSGPLTVASYMTEILTNPESGYYMSRDVFGQKGDFITSPEIGQIFGEMIAIWCLTEYQKIGSPLPLQIIELGPGRATLIQDFLRVFDKFKVSKKLTIHLVELSPYLSTMQAQKLCYSSSKMDQESGLPYYQTGETLGGVRIFWYRRIEDIPKEFSIILAHEFFDVLPIHKLQRDGSCWKEILVDKDPTDVNKFRYVLSRNETPVSKLFSSMRPNEKRNHVEISLQSDLIAQQIAERIESFGGIGLIMDYGHEGEKEDTFRAFKNHQLCDALHEPGSADITADVDFKNLKNILQTDDKVIAFGPVEQGTFLKRMGADVRLEKLLENCEESEIENLKTGLDMLINPQKMGSRFKFLSVFPHVLKDHLDKFPVMGF
ncbi:CLUMA_CG011848, isoform A [Clunio marinus]|uniref:Protein arginine methyltransferase NDUFAF7 n=1 Tax=Clunio marinus TaxID=568069 RepID=A0A1J1IE57_9DIPT|nr:CLUMA_CG011848, isoform A [Clunio marinus]